MCLIILIVDFSAITLESIINIYFENPLFQLIFIYPIPILALNNLSLASLTSR